MYYLESRYYDPQTGRFLNADSLEYLGDGEDLKNYNLFAYCENNPVMNVDPTGHAAVSVTALGAIVGAIIGAIIGGIVAYNIAKNNGAKGWDLVKWTSVGVIGGGIIGGLLGAGIGALITKTTGITGFSVTKHSVVPIKKITLLGHRPGYIELAKTTRSGHYQIPNNIYNYLKGRGIEWVNNMQYLKDANTLGSQFVVAPDWVVLQKGTLVKEIQYLIENGIPWILF